MDENLSFSAAQTANELSDGGGSNIERLINLGLGAYSGLNAAKLEKAQGIKSLANPSGVAAPAPAGGFALDQKTILIGALALGALVLGAVFLKR
jgi:hypothetical protein